MKRDKLYLRGASFASPSTKLFEGVLERCPFRLGPDRRECGVAGIGCKYGMSNSVLPEDCPIKNATLIVTMNTQSLDLGMTAEYNRKHPDNPIKVFNAYKSLNSGDDH